MRSIRAGRGDRTTHDQGDPSTVGVDLHTHMLRDSTRCKLYDLAGQLDYRGLHQLFLTESALYIVVFDVTFFEGKQDNALSEVRARDLKILTWKMPSIPDGNASLVARHRALHEIVCSSLVQASSM